MHMIRRTSLAAAAALVLAVLAAGCTATPPASLNVTAGDGTAVVDFESHHVFTYQIEVMPGGRIVDVPTSPAVVTGLTNGTAYTFAVRAISAAGVKGDWSAHSAPVTPKGRPSAPTITSVAGFVSLDGCTARVAVTPASNGGSPILRYEVTSSANPSHPVTGTSSPIEVPGLLQHTPYTFTVTAVNALGASPASAPFTGTCS